MSHVIRIIHVALQLDTGGMERLLAEFARHADRGGFSLRFVALGARGGVADEIESCGWPVTAVGAGPGVRPSTMYRLARLFRDEGTDIVHTHSTKPMLYAGPAARLAGVGGVVHTCHGQRRGITKRQNTLFRLAGRCIDRMVCVSEDSTRLCAGDGIDPHALRTIWNGIDLRRFAYTGPDADGPAVFVGRLAPEKDLATLVRAAAIAVGQRPTFRLKIAGAGLCASEMVALARSLGLGENVEFLGEVRDVPGLLRAASVLVLPSLTEGIPLCVLEAMACGLPVVATRVGGTPEAVEDGVTGLLVESRQPAELADAMLRVCADAEMGRRMGFAGHKRVSGLFDVRTMVSRYESLYSEVLRDSKALAA